ncbi:MAG: hypothetical protein HY553_12850 [Elusimicrobia bacterium]|nr:hypothetical protein [Elusimicrobiota bacterium]
MIQRLLAVLLLVAPAAAEFEAPAIPAAKVVRPPERRGTVQCADIKVSQPGPLATQPVWLQSNLYAEYGYQGLGMHDPESRRASRIETGEAHRERVQLELAGTRNTFPWETEVFEACLEGNRTTLRAKRAAYRYEITEDPSEPGNFLLVAREKQPLDPDAEGIEASLAASQGRLTLWLKDRWHAHYAGERLAVRGELWEAVDRWPDSKAGTLEAEIPSFTGEFGLSFSGTFRPGRSYYARWSFRRIGKVSTNTEVRGRETAPVVLTP